MRVKQFDVIEIANIPNKAARLLFECVLPENQNVRELTNAFDVILAFLRLDAPIGPLEFSKPLALTVEVV
jgi:hypothetical protein